MTACARKKVLLMILDGWGIGRGDMPKKLKSRA